MNVLTVDTMNHKRMFALFHIALNNAVLEFYAELFSNKPVVT